jgi:hypothetical protein
MLLKQYLSCSPFLSIPCYSVILHSCSCVMHIKATTAQCCWECPLLCFLWATDVLWGQRKPVHSVHPVHSLMILSKTGFQCSEYSISGLAPSCCTAENSFRDTLAFFILLSTQLLLIFLLLLVTLLLLAKLYFFGIFGVCLLCGQIFKGSG